MVAKMATKKKIKTNSTYKELMIGIILYGILGIIPIVIFIHDEGKSIIGFSLGVVISAGMLIHMYRELEKALYMGEIDAEKHTKMTTCLRMVVVTIALVAIAFSGKADIIASLVGTMALKVSAYIQPLTHKFLKK